MIYTMGECLNCFQFGAIMDKTFLCLHALVSLGHVRQRVKLIEHRLGICLILLVCAKGCSE